MLLIFRTRDWSSAPKMACVQISATRQANRAMLPNWGKAKMADAVETIVRELKDRQDILDCLVRYCRGVDRLDRNILRSAYHDNAVDDHGEYVGDVEGFIDWAFDYHITHQLRTVHAITNHTCELTGDTAHTETYWTFTALNRNAPSHPRNRSLHRSTGKARWPLGHCCTDLCADRAGQWHRPPRSCR